MDRFVVNHLKKDELRHELAFRSISTTDDQTVDDLRSCLRPLIKLEKSRKNISYPNYNPDFDSEKVIINTKIDELGNLVREVQSCHSKTKFDRVQSRLLHLFDRSNRIPVTTDNSTERSKLISKVLSLLDSLENIPAQNDPNLSVILNSSVLNEQSSGESDSELPQNNTPFSSVKPEAIHKWNIRFNGDCNVMSVYEFLDRVSEMRIARRVSEKVLYESAYDLFDGKARRWFVNNRNRFHNWRGLTDLLITHYSTPDYKPRLFQNILERTQDPNEPIIEYLNSMYSMFRRYGTVSEDIQVDIIMRNLSPFYSSQLGSVSSLQELETECIRLETKKFRVDNYASPSQKHINFVDKEFSTFTPQSPKVRFRPNNIVHEITAPTISSNPNCTTSGSSAGIVDTLPNTSVDPVNISESLKRKQLTCWNCKQVGHVNRNCPQPKNIHCYKCGAPGVTSRNCRICNVSGNESQGNQ